MLFFQSAVIGAAIAAPVGPIGLLCMQRSLRHGFARGLATGMGAACVDALYGLLGALGFASLLSAFPALASILRFGGGVMLVWMAINMLRSSSAAATDTGQSQERAFAASFVLTLSNPMTIVSFLAIFASFGAREPGIASTIVIVAGVFLGSAAWWVVLSAAAAFAGRRMQARSMRSVTVIAAVVLFLMGIWALVASQPGSISPPSLG